MKKQLLPLLLIILLPGCLNLKQKKRAAKKLGTNEKIILTNKKNKKIDQEIDFILEDSNTSFLNKLKSPALLATISITLLLNNLLFNGDPLIIKI